MDLSKSRTPPFHGKYRPTLFHRTNLCSQVGERSNPKGIRGKFYKWDNKDNEISSGEVDKLQSNDPGSDMSVASCGRSDSASGTEGSFDVYEGTTRICNIYWSCPWGAKSNIFTVGDVNESYIVQSTGANLESGAIGTVTVKVAKLW